MNKEATYGKVRRITVKNIVNKKMDIPEKKYPVHKEKGGSTKILFQYGKVGHEP